MLTNMNSNHLIFERSADLGYSSENARNQAIFDIE